MRLWSCVVARRADCSPRSRSCTACGAGINGVHGAARVMLNGDSGLEVGDQREQVLFAQLSGERGHQRRIARHDLGTRQQDRIAEVALIGNDGGAIGKMYRAAIEAFQGRARGLMHSRRGNRAAMSCGKSRARALPGCARVVLRSQRAYSAWRITTTRPPILE